MDSVGLICQVAAHLPSYINYLDEGMYLHMHVFCLMAMFEATIFEPATFYTLSASQSIYKAHYYG